MPLSDRLPASPLRSPRTAAAAAVALLAGLGVASLPPTGAGAQAAPGPVVDGAIARSPELSETTRLSDRRFVVTGDRAWALGTADGRYPAAGFHTRGEMGGFWLPNLKLLDGMWFDINGDWIGKGHQDDLRLGLRAGRPADHRRRVGQPHRLRATRRLRRAGRAHAALRHATGPSRCARTHIRS